MNKTVKKLSEWVKGLSGYNDKGEEIPDPTPLEPPVDFERPLPLAEEIRRLVRSQAIITDLDRAGIETFDEADDFDVDDDQADPTSPWEENFDHGKVWTREQEIRAGIVQQPDIKKAKEDIEAFQNASRKRQASNLGGENKKKVSQHPPKPEIDDEGDQA